MTGNVGREVERTFGQELRRLRKSRGVTQLQLATAVGVDISYISKIETGRMHPPSVATIQRICATLVIPPDELLVLAGKVSSNVLNTITSSLAAVRFVRTAQSVELSEGEWQDLTRQIKHSRKRTVETLEPGDHVCCLSGTEREQRYCAVAFVRQGLAQNEKVLYATDSPETILDWLRADGLEVQPLLASGQLTVRDSDSTYVQDGIFDVQRMIDLLRTEIEHAMAEGYNALRITGEMNWVLRGLPGSEHIIEYETKVSKLLPNIKCLAMCQYDRHQIPATLLLSVLAIHPLVAVGTLLYENFFYIEPSKLSQ